jgi:transcriptional regulator with XRE-family HTH domain
MTSREETGACLRALRALRGWNQRQTAAAAHLPPTRLSDYESGKTSPTLDRLEAIVTALGFPMLTFEIARQLVRTGQTADTPPREAPSVPTAARVLELHGCGFRRRRPPIPMEGDHPSERGGERRLMVG